MKKIIISLLLAFLPVLLFAGLDTPIFGEFGFKNHYTYERFQQYVGQTVMYLPCEPLNYSEESVFKTQKFIPGAEYVIIDISPKKGFAKPFSKITITFQEANSNKRLKMKTYFDWAYEFPFFFIDKFNAQKANMPQFSVSDDLVKGEYILTDMKLEKLSYDTRMKNVVYYVANSAIGRSFTANSFDEAKSMANAFLKEDKSGSYHSELVKVEKPEDSSERYSDVKTVQDQDVSKYSFEDDIIDIVIFGDNTQFSFKIKNKAKNSIKIIWDDAVFVDCNGSTSKIMHSGIKYSQKEASQPASTIIGGAYLEDIACPISNVRYSEILHEWVTDSMYPTEGILEKKQMRLMLPIQIKDVVNEYVFVFDVTYTFNYPSRIRINQ
jgi:hypothetical protein